MSLISSVVAFAKADAEGKGIPVLITLLQGLAASKTSIQRAAAILKFEGDAVAAGATIGQDILTDLVTTAEAELQALPPPATPPATPPAA
jgi:hypothetical protein